MSLKTEVKNNKSSFWSSVGLAAGYLIITLAGVLIMYSGTDNSFVDRHDGTTFVEASWSKIAQDGIPGWGWVALAIAIGTFTQMIWSFRKGFGAAKEKDVTFIVVLLASWIIGWVIIFSGTVSRYGDSNYQEIIPTEQYERLKSEGKLDSLFPG